MTDPTEPAVEATAPQFSSLIESAQRLGSLRWAEMQLFELLGGWVQSTEEPDAKLLFAVNSHHHAEHAATLLGRLPAAGEWAAELVTAPAHPTIEPVLVGVADLGDDQTLERLVAVYRVIVPALLVAYAVHIERTNEVADAAVRRSLRMVIDDESRDWRAGQALIARRLVDSASVGRAAAFQQRLEIELLEAGGLSR